MTLTPEERQAGQRAWAHRNRHKLQAAQNARHATDPRKSMLSHAKNRAARIGVPFSITRADVPVPSHCPVLGVPLVVGRGTLHAGSPTIDRVKPGLGYVPGNVAVISHRANRIKGDATVNELLHLITWLQKRN